MSCICLVQLYVSYKTVVLDKNIVVELVDFEIGLINIYILCVCVFVCARACACTSVCVPR